MRRSTTYAPKATRERFGTRVESPGFGSYGGAVEFCCAGVWGPQSQALSAFPPGKQVCPPEQPAGPTQACDAPGKQRASTDVGGGVVGTAGAAVCSSFASV